MAIYKMQCIDCFGNPDVVKCESCGNKCMEDSKIVKYLFQDIHDEINKFAMDTDKRLDSISDSLDKLKKDFEKLKKDMDFVHGFYGTRKTNNDSDEEDEEEYSEEDEEEYEIEDEKKDSGEMPELE